MTIWPAFTNSHSGVDGSSPRKSRKRSMSGSKRRRPNGTNRRFCTVLIRVDRGMIRPLGGQIALVLWSAVPPRSIKSPDLDCGRRFIPEDLGPWIFTHARRPLRPGASVPAVCPPAFRVPTLSVVSLRLSQPKTALVISTSAPSTESFTCLTSFSRRPPCVLISTLGSADLMDCSPITNHSSAVWRCPQHSAARRTRRRRKTLLIIDLHITSLLLPLIVSSRWSGRQ